MASLKDRIVKAFPIFSKLLATGRPPLVKQALTTTSGAGAKTIAGICPGDQLVSVVDMTLLVDLTSEFRIKAKDTIDNTGGTAIAASTKLMVTYLTWDLDR